MTKRPYLPDTGELAWTVFDPVRPFPTSVVLPDGLPVSGEILLSYLRSIDIETRPMRYAGARVPAHTAELVRAKLSGLITI